MINKVIFLGYVGKEPAVQTFQDGGMITTLSIATSERGFTAKDGTQVPEKNEWHRVILKGGLASIADKYVHKGDQLYLEGKLVHRSYESNGEKKFVSEVVCDKLQMLKSGNSGSDGNAGPGQGGEDDIPY